MPAPVFMRTHQKDGENEHEDDKEKDNYNASRRGEEREVEKGKEKEKEKAKDGEVHQYHKRGSAGTAEGRRQQEKQLELYVQIEF